MANSNLRTLVWERLDSPGTGMAILDRQPPWTVRGAVVATASVPHVLRYRITCDPGWAVRSADLHAEGAGWARELRLSRDGGTWRVTTQETGSLDDALNAAGHPPAPLPGADDPDGLSGVLDVHVATVPLTLTPLLRRTGLRLDGEAVEVRSAYVLVPALSVISRVETITMIDPTTVTLTRDGHCAAVEIDSEQLVTHYPGLVQRID
ncbi:putative glycolipid-binding domain-containing protein [Couchioplanes caeruleus]|uniref:putative glycolipid-binding domain-containing protein n=1 Tax=Couchioplanes caeruleus TaxID=56438 RepID=UPI0020BE0404|nr:putative glycolipid-binding domain-containing protein [Couchioplanes caeruleus]UQU62646.1 putative glycolipid-binding domain-containing protein [Couchioplanes caeruleus]